MPLAKNATKIRRNWTRSSVRNVAPESQREVSRPSSLPAKKGGTGQILSGEEYYEGAKIRRIKDGPGRRRQYIKARTAKVWKKEHTDFEGALNHREMSGYLSEKKHPIPAYEKIRDL